MPSSIRSNRPDLSERFPVAGLTVRTAPGQGYFEVAVASDPKLFDAAHRGDRSATNFYSSRAAGILPANHGEAVYLLPTNALSRFAGSERLYYALATFSDRDRGNPEIVRVPPEIAPFIHIAKTFTGRARAINGVANVRGGLTGDHYGASSDSLIWAGDTMEAGTSQPVAIKSAQQNGSSMNGSDKSRPGAMKASAAALAEYDDGLGPMDYAQSDQDADDGPGIEGPIPDQAVMGQAQGYSRPFVAAEYPQASRFVPAAATNFRAGTGVRTINRIVIHITDGGRNIDGPISWFQNPQARVSAHYVVGQDGEVVQMVHHNDIAYHANSANRDSIGIEHVANVHGLMPTEAEYSASAALVNWLCNQFNLPMDRTHVLGHSEADPHTTHTDCPNSVWNWDYYMSMVSSGTSQPMPTASSLAYDQRTSKAKNGHQKNKGYGARPLAEVAPLDAPTDPAALAAFMKDWQSRRQAWAAGVPDTSLFPFSAICQLRIDPTDSGYGQGTGFYIAPDRILTCAHNCHGASSITVIPGKNDRVTPSEPYGSFTVQSRQWTIHPQYNHDAPGQDREDFDLAVIQVTTPPPNGAYFDFLEELNQSRPSPIMVCGYAASNVDRDRQHLDADMIRQVTDNRIQYNIQTTPGNSGSPVFYIEVWEDDTARASVQETRLVGVHVSNFDPTLNQACRLTQDKISWIRSVGSTTGSGVTQSLGALGKKPVSRPMPSKSMNGNGKSAKPAGTLAYNIIRPTYTPGDPEEAKRFMAQWAARRERWRAGVQDTTIFPHSAICQLRTTTPNGNFLGTGAYIDRDLILTCAHVCDGATSITVIPGKNDLANPAEPFSSFSVDSTAWTTHPQYNSRAAGLSSHDFDLAVIRVPTGPPNGLYFSTLEELLVSQSSPIMVCGYAAESVSQDRQHLDGDQIQSVQDERFSYDIQTEGGSSGSPIFYLVGWEDDQARVSRQELRIIGVHTNLGVNADGTISSTENGGCRLTQTKIQWIDGFRTARSQSLGYKNGKRSTTLAAEVFADPDVQRMRSTITANASRRGAAPPDNLVVLKAGLQSLYGAALQQANGTARPLGDSMEEVMAALVSMNLAAPEQDFDFVDQDGAPTRGSTRPEHLETSVEDWIMSHGVTGGWRCFGLTLLDGYHNVILALAFNGANNPATKLYWLDQIHGGFDDVTRSCDTRITAHTQNWWDPLEQAQKVSTKVSVWPLNP